MAIEGFSEDAFKAVLRENFTPSNSIKTPERLFGRDKALKQIDRALASQGRQVFIYGDRGVGKTSVALTAAYMLNDSSEDPLYVACGESDNFADAIASIGNACIPIEKRMEEVGAGPEFGATILGIGGSFKAGKKAQARVQPPKSLNDALDILRFVLKKRQGMIVVVIDEMERLPKKEREKFAEVIKNLPELDDRLKFIFCGIATTVNELLGSHPSAGRILETIPLERLHHNFLWDIIKVVGDKAGVSVAHETLVRISQISDGFPHYVHLIGASMFWSVFDDEAVIARIERQHFKAGVSGAIDGAEAILRHQYEKATMKTKNTEDYEDALWALADRTLDRRQMNDIFEQSYPKIVSGRRRAPLERKTFNHRMLALRKESHASIVVGFGSGWFGFRENIMRGYVRLQAEKAGIELGRDGSMT
jgi:Cdc6-like AAA superfamily ATPase